MPKISKPSPKKPTAKAKKVAVAIKKPTNVIKKISATENKVKAPIKISKTYIPKDTEKYMCDKHLSFFKIKLTEWKKELVKANNEALYHGSMDDNSVSADIVDQASSYTDKTVISTIPLTRWAYFSYAHPKSARVAISASPGGSK